MPKSKPSRSKSASRSVSPRRTKVSRSSSTAIVPVAQLSMPEALEKVLIGGDLSPLSVEERIDYYKRMCNTLSLNPLTQPFSYILFRESDNSPAKLSLYANKSCSEQLRKIHHVSIAKMRREIRDDVCMVEVDVIDKTGRMDTATGVVALYKFYQGKRELLTPREHANAIMKCETKAKRRATLSICGLALLDESELDTMHVVGGITPDGRVFRYAEEPQIQPQLQENIDHGHEPGSDKAKMAEAALKRVEDADKAHAATKTAPKPTEAPKVAPAPPARSAAPTGKPIPPEKLAEVWPKKDSGQQEAAPEAQEESGRNGASAQTQTQPNDGLTLLKGNIVRSVMGTTKHHQPFLSVRIGNEWHSSFNNRLFEFIVNKDGQVIECWLDAKKAIVGLQRVGRVSFDTDGHTPCIQRDREPGTKALF